MSTLAGVILLVGRILFVALFLSAARGHIQNHPRYVEGSGKKLPFPILAGDGNIILEGGTGSQDIIAGLRGDGFTTVNLDNPGEGCDLDFVPRTARKAQMEYAMSNSFGFGGTNGCLVFKRWEE